MRSETNGHLQVQVPAKGGILAQTIYQLEFVTSQGLKSHKLEFANELVRPKEKWPSSEPSTYHISIINLSLGVP